MLVRISDYAWVRKKEFPGSKLTSLKDSLTIQRRKTSKHQDEVPPVFLYKETEGRVGIPRSFFIENQRLAHEFVDERSAGHPVDLVFNADLREYQEEPVAKTLAEIEAGRPGGIIRAKTGAGKTVMGLKVFTAAKMSALVTVHRGYLKRQWVKRIKKFIPDARVGVIQGDRCEYGPDYDITIAMIDTLVSRKDDYPEEFWTSFGLVMTDEVHRIGAPTWAEVVPMFNCMYRLGLTATPRRKDGAENVFFWHIGPIVASTEGQSVTPRLRRIFTDFKLIKTPKFDPNLASKEIQLRFLCKNPDRNKLIVNELKKATDAGRKVLILSERRKHLEIVREMFGPIKSENVTVDFYVGGMPEHELDIAENADVILSTYQMAKEGLDIEDLDTLFLISPVSDVEQAAGRIMRIHDEKKEPVITDFIDQHVKNMIRAWNSRRAFYVAKGMHKEKS